MKEQVIDPLDKPKGYFKWMREEMLPFIPDDVEKILEIGCGSGAFAQLLKQNRKVEIWGMDIHEEAVKEAYDIFDRILINNIEKDVVDLPLNYFDCILFNDVLEHLTYPWNVLAEIQKYMSNNSYVVASVPNVRYYDNLEKLLINKDWNYESKGILDITHLRFFTEKSIVNMFEKSGYRVLKIEGINSRYRSKKFRLFNFMLGGWINDISYCQFACVAQPTRDKI